MAADIGGDAGDITQRIKITVTAEGTEVAKEVAAELKNLNNETQKISGPASAGAAGMDRFAAAAFALQTKIDSLNIAMLGQEKQSDRYRRMVESQGRAQQQLNEIVSQSGPAYDRLVVAQQKAAETATKAAQAQAASAKATTANAVATTQAVEAEAQLAAAKKKTIDANMVSVNSTTAYADALAILKKEFEATIGGQMFFVDLMHDTVTETGMVAAEQVRLTEVYNLYLLLLEKLDAEQLENINREQLKIRQLGLEEMAIRGVVEAQQELRAQNDAAGITSGLWTKGGMPIVNMVAQGSKTNLGGVPAALAAQQKAFAGMTEEARGLSMQIEKVKATAAAMHESFIVGDGVARGEMKKLTMQTMALDAWVEKLKASGQTMTASMTTGMTEAAAATKVATANFVEADLVTRRLDAQMNLAAGRARGLRGILNAWGMEMLSIGLIFGLAFEMVMRGLGKLDRWLEDPKSSGSKWLDDWKKRLRLWKDAVEDAVTDVFEKMSHTSVNARGMLGSDILGAADRYSRQAFQANPEAKNIQLVGNESDLLAKVTQKAIDAELAMTGMTVNSVKNINELRENLASLGDRTDAVANQMRDGFFKQFEAGMAKIVLSANKDTREILRAIEQMNAVGLSFKIGDLKTENSLKAQTEAWLGEYAALAKSMDDKVTDYFVFKTKGMIQSMLDDAAHLGQKLPKLIQQQADALHIKSDLDVEADKKAEKARQAGEKYMKEFNAGMAQAANFKQAGDKLDQQIMEAINAIRVKESDNPLEQIASRVEKRWSEMSLHVKQQIQDIKDALPGSKSKAQTAELNTELARLQTLLDAIAVARPFDLQIQQADAVEEHLKKVVDQYEKLEAEAIRTATLAMDSLRDLPTGIRGNAESEMSALIDKYNRDRYKLANQGFDAATYDAELSKLKTAFDHNAKVIKDAADYMVASGVNWRHEIEVAAENFRQGTSAMLQDLALTGGKNFGQIAGQMFVRSVAQGSDIIVKLFQQAVAGAFGGNVTTRDLNPATGKKYTSEEALAKNKAADDQAAVLSGQIGTLVGAVGQGFNMIKSAQKGNQVESADILASTVSFAIAGAAIGGWIGAIVGAVVGAALGIISQKIAKDKLPYAQYGIREGEAYVEPYAGQDKRFDNLTASQIADMKHQLQNTFNEMTDGYIGLLLKFPLTVLSAINLSASAMDFAPLMKTAGTIKDWSKAVGIGMSGVAWVYLLVHGKGPEKKFGSDKDGDIYDPNLAGTKKGLRPFMTDFDNYVKNLLPARIAESFKASVGVAFTAMGMTTERFGAVWDKLKGMDPKEALKVLNDMADALIAFQKVFDFTKNIGTEFSDAFSRGANLTRDGSAQLAGVSDFEQSLLDSGEALLKEGIAIRDMVGPEQIAAAKQLGDNLLKLKDALTQFLNSIIQMTQRLHESIQEARFGLKMDALGDDKQGQSDLLTKRLISDYNRIRSAVNPDEIDRYTQDAMDTINKLYQMDPNKRRQWADDQLSALDQLQQENLKRLGDAAIAQFQSIVDAMQPVMDWFKGLPDEFGNTIDSLTASTQDAADAMANFAAGNKTPAGGFHKYRDEFDARQEARDEARLQQEKENADKTAQNAQPTFDQINKAIADAITRFGGTRGSAADAAAAAVAAVQRLYAEQAAAAPPSLNTDNQPLEWAAHGSVAGFKNGKFIMPEGGSKDLMAYYVENALIQQHNGGYKPAAAHTADDKNGVNSSNPVIRNTALLVEATNRQTKAIDRMADAIERGDHIDGNIRVTVDGTTGRPRSSFATTVATRRVTRT